MKHYDILGVEPGATFVEVRRAYRLKALQLHPDRNPAPDAEERFKELQAAYFVVRDHAAKWEGYVGPRAVADARWEAEHLDGERDPQPSESRLREEEYRALHRAMRNVKEPDGLEGCCLTCLFVLLFCVGASGNGRVLMLFLLLCIAFFAHSRLYRR